jgi:1,4-alpha-glucan branching enzyme
MCFGYILYLRRHKLARMRNLLALVAVLLCGVVHAQLLTWTPDFPVENDPSQTLVITMDASKGNKGLLNYSATGDVYVHIGVITNKSSSGSDWKYSKFTWGTTLAAANAPYAGNNKWQYTIAGSLRTFFGITDATESIQKIAILFRSGNGNTAQRNADGSDMYIPVYTSALAVRLNQPAREPKYIAAGEPQNWTAGSAFTVQAVANKPSTLTLYHNGNVIATATNAQAISGGSTVAADGNQEIKVEANDGTTSQTDILNVFVSPVSSPVAPLPAGVRDGINYEAGGTAAVLVLHAPEKNKALVVGDFNDWTQNIQYLMNKTPDGKKFWIRLTGLNAATEYGFQYIIDDNLRIADPYAQKVLDPQQDPFISTTTYPNLKAYPTGKTSGIVGVLNPSQTSYTWTSNTFTRPDKRGLVVYELLVRDFVAAHDWKTLRDTLTYLKRLGVNAVELMPLNEFEGNLSWGYNPDFYFAPDKYYGPANSLKEFVDVCHSNGIAVVMDIALNHSFGQSPMVQLYWDAANNRPAANSPWFNPVAKHPFNVGYDMNHESLDTRYFTSRVVEHWLTEYRIDGFRFDLSKGFTQVNSGDNVSTWSNYDASRIAIWKRYYDSVQLKSPGAYVILEHFAVNQEEKELSDYGMLLWGNLNYNYNEGTKGNVGTSNFQGVFSTARTWTYPYLVGYMESHDEERLMRRNIIEGNTANPLHNTRDTTIALKRMELGAAFFFTVPGPKMVWQFGELGYDYSINHCTNGTVNNDCRLDNKPIRWDYKADARRAKLFEVYSNLIRLRFHPWYRDAFMSNRVEYSLTNGFKWIKVTTDTSNLVVVGNFDVGSTTGTVTFPGAGTWFDYLENTTFTASGGSQSITLLPGEYHVYVNRNVNNISTTPIREVINSGSALEAAIFPNPVRTGFSVALNLPQSGAVRIELVNTVGQQVATLHEGFKARGKQVLTFNREAFGLAAGNYYLKVTHRNQQKIIQVTIH